MSNTPAAPKKHPSMPALLRDPLFHFVLLGLVLFAVFALLQGRPANDEAITVSIAQQQQLAAAFQRVWRRAPTAEEFKGLVDDWVREELANREARAMALDREDLVIRRRLRQKYESLMEQIASAIQPTEAELMSFYEERRNDYRIPDRYDLRQRFFSSDRRADSAADARAALDGIDIADPSTDIGDPIALPAELSGIARTEVAARFGDAFADALDDLPLARWAGPVPSAYGHHLVYLSARTAAEIPPLASVSAEVDRDWREVKRREAREALYDGLLERYDVVIEASLEGQP